MPTKRPEAIAMLMEDHNEVKKLFKDYRAAGPRARVKRKNLYERIRRDLEMHTAVEEAVFYPAARPIDRELISEGLKEHETVDKLIMSLSRIEPDNARFDQQMTELMKNVEHHVGEEEGELFPKVR